MGADHVHSEYALDRDVNGLGRCVNEVKQSQAREEARTERNSEDIQKLFDLVGTTAENVHRIETTTIESISELKVATTAAVAAVDKKVGAMRWQIAGAVGGAMAVLAGVWKVVSLVLR